MKANQIHADNYLRMKQCAGDINLCFGRKTVLLINDLTSAYLETGVLEQLPALLKNFLRLVSRKEPQTGCGSHAERRTMPFRLRNYFLHLLQ